MPKPVTIFDSYVALWADMSDPNISEMQIPPHFTNIQHALQMGRQFLSRQDTANRQIILITDGLPTAHFEGSKLYLLYPPDRSDRAGHAARRRALPARRDHDQHFPAAKLGAIVGRHSVRLPAGRIDQPAASSSPPAKTSTATWSGTTSTAAARSWRKYTSPKREREGGGTPRPLLALRAVCRRAHSLALRAGVRRARKTPALNLH